MENVVVQMINQLPHDAFRHTVISLTDADPDFTKRVGNRDTTIIELHKLPGHPVKLYPVVYRLLREHRPDVIHTCNIAALEFMPIAALARVPLRIHAEHGWDVNDQGGSNAAYRLLRRLYKPFVHQYVAVSRQLYDYLHDVIGIPERRLNLIANGVDTDLFRPSRTGDALPQGWPFRRSEHFVVGTVGRLAPVKNQTLLAEAFVAAASSDAPGADRLRLAIIGDGELAGPIRHILASAGLEDRVWMPGNRGDIPEVLRALDCFVLPSLSEATSCTLQESMATGLDIVATDVGGNPDLLEGGRLGRLVPSGDIEAMAKAILDSLRKGTGAARELEARDSIERRYGLSSIMDRYQKLFASSQT